MKSVSRRMSSDWNRRARTDAFYYVALGQPKQSVEEFLRGAGEVIGELERELARLPAHAARPGRALEIGCGPGRLMIPMSRHFSEIHGVDVSEEMIRLAGRNLAGVPHAHLHTGNGTDLAGFADEYFDFVYSFAVFQHIPSRAVVANYLCETHRVLAPGGVARIHFNGLADGARNRDTWSGVSFTATDIAGFARQLDLRLVALEGAGSQYMWATFLKPPFAAASSPDARVVVHAVTDASGTAAAVPVRGRRASFALWIEGLPAAVDLNTLRVEVAGKCARLTYIGPPAPEGTVQVSGILPMGLDPGVQSVHIVAAGVPLPAEAPIHLVPPAPEVPEVIAVTDSVFAGSGRTICSGRLRVHLEGASRPEELRAFVENQELRRTRIVCSVSDFPRFEIDFRLPAGLPRGLHRLGFIVENRHLEDFDIVVSPDRFWWRRCLHPAEFFQSLRRAYWRWSGKWTR